jgi:hypothetical protein
MLDTQPPTAYKVGVDLYLAARPDSQDPGAFYDLSQLWSHLQFDQQSGPVFDQVNQLTRAWWHDGSNAAFVKCHDAINALGEVLGFPEPVAVHD